MLGKQLMVLGKHQLICFVPENHGVNKTLYIVPFSPWLTKNSSLAKNLT